jgi:hypothetical protein
MGTTRRLHNKAVGIIRRAALWASVQAAPGYAQTAPRLLAAGERFRVANARCFFRAFRTHERAPWAGSCIALGALGIDVHADSEPLQ